MNVQIFSDLIFRIFDTNFVQIIRETYVIVIFGIYNLRPDNIKSVSDCAFRFQCILYPIKLRSVPWLVSDWLRPLSSLLSPNLGSYPTSGIEEFYVPPRDRFGARVPNFNDKRPYNNMRDAISLLGRDIYLRVEHCWQEIYTFAP